MVPWVAGWEGPICSSMISAGRFLLSAFSGTDILVFAPQCLFQPQKLVVRTFIDKGSFDLAFRNPVLLLIDRVVLAQWMTLEFIKQQDSPEIRMIDELDAEHIPDFPLHKVGASPERRQ